MSGDTTSVQDLHWLMDMLQSIDVGLIVLDRQYRVQIWNSFMENHSGLRPDGAIGRGLFELFPELDDAWLKRKTDAVFMLKTRAFATWEQHPYLLQFKNYRPITGPAQFMYQNINFIPLLSASGEVNHVGIIIYDVTDIAVGRRELEAANDKLAALSRTDRLTKLFNRGHWEERLAEEFRRARRNKAPSSLVMFDIDHFKKVNDTYGHQAGDEVIRHTARELLQTARATDICGRYGGEEFAVILTDTDAEHALVFCERLRETIAKAPVVHDGREIAYTISLGVADLSEDVADYPAWVERADQALYQSKHSGRNRSTAYGAA
jgi:diguanylate cyclase (GGDEF)-like protein